MRDNNRQRLSPLQQYFNDPMSRRSILGLGARLSAALALAGLPAIGHSAARRLTSLGADPFTLGVASGDPTSDAVVLWTRLSREVLQNIGAQEGRA
jgi:alkaline phosphatase D